MSTANLDSADLKGVAYQGLVHEDVMDKIWDISKVPLPLTDMIGEDSASQSYKEWTTDELAAPDTDNAVIDGADATGNNAKTGARVGNHCQMSDKVVRVSTRARNSNTIGRNDELAYQLMKRQQELKRDVEAIALTSQASVADNGNDTAGRAGGLGAWLETNVSRGATGANGGFSNGVVTAPTNGTHRAMTETMVRDVAENVYEQGGNPTVFMSIPKLVRKFSSYLFTSDAQIAQPTAEVGQSEGPATAKGSINIFVTDHGVTLTLIGNRLQQPEIATASSEDCNAYLIDPEYIALAYLQGYRTSPLAKTGTAENRQMTVDWTLVVRTEKAHGLIADIDYTAAVTA